MPTHWNVDRRLNIFILGPMPSAKSVDSSCRVIKRAIETILVEPEIQQTLHDEGTTAWQVDIPEEQDGADIINSIFAKVDVADLVVVNITPKDAATQTFSPNVFYELGLVHSLGIPYLLLSRENTPAPFYLSGNRIHAVADFAEDTLRDAIRAPLLKVSPQ